MSFEGALSFLQCSIKQLGHYSLVLLPLIKDSLYIIAEHVLKFKIFLSKGKNLKERMKRTHENWKKLGNKIILRNVNSYFYRLLLFLLHPFQ